MTTIEETLGRCERLRADGSAAGIADVAWLVECFDHPLKIVQRTAGESLAALAAAGVEVADALDGAMEHGSFRRRWTAAWTAARISRKATAPQLAVLLEAIGVEDGDVRWAAARILGAGDQARSVIDRLVDLTTGGNAEQRKMAVYCLRDLMSSEAPSVACYRAALADPSPGVRLAGMSALARIARGSPTEARRIAALVDDPDGGVRRAAAATVGRMGVADDEVRARLTRAAADDDPVLGRTARAALASLG